MAKPMRLGELAERLGGRSVEGDADFEVAGVAGLDAGGPRDLGFLRSAAFEAELAASKIGAVIAPEGVATGERPTLRSARPSLDFARVVAWLVPAPPTEPGVHPSAAVSPEAHLDGSVCVGAGAVVGPGCRIGRGSVLHARVTLYPGVEIGADCTIHSGAVLREGSRVGDRVVIQPSVVIGGDGFGFELDEHGRWEKVPQVGHVEIGDDVEIGAGTTVDRARLGTTRIGRGVKIDNLVQIGHNCDIGEDSVLVAQSGLAGGSVLGRRVILMAQSGVGNRARLGDGSFVGPRGGIISDLDPGERRFGFPGLPEGRWHRAMAVFARLPDLWKRLRALERKAQAEAAADKTDEELPLP